METHLPQLSRIYQNNILAVGNNITRNSSKGAIYKTEGVNAGGNRGIPTKGEYFHHPVSN
jgi:hypothetical protein